MGGPPGALQPALQALAEPGRQRRTQHGGRSGQAGGRAEVRKRAPEVIGCPAPCRGLCGAADAPALSISGPLGLRPWGCGSRRRRGSVPPRHGPRRRGTAGASLRSSPCPAASAPLGLSHPGSGSSASFSFCSVLPVGPRPRLVLSTPTLPSAGLGLSCPRPELGLAHSFPS